MLLGREQRLDNAGIYLRGAEAFFDSEGRVMLKARGLARALEYCRAPVVLGCNETCNFRELLPDTFLRVVRFPTLPFVLRRQLWQRELAAAFCTVDTADVDALANHFTLSGGQIVAAVRSAVDGFRMREGSAAFPSRADLLAAARAQSQQQLRSLAQRIEPLYSWADVMLPAATLRQLRDIESALKFRHVVLGDWGFEKRFSLGRGLKALFPGLRAPARP